MMLLKGVLVVGDPEKGMHGRPCFEASFCQSHLQISPLCLLVDPEWAALTSVL